jgi:Sec-independent protein translocase protein TatA
MNIGWTEFLVIAMIGLIVFGPERLPEMSAQFAK